MKVQLASPLVIQDLISPSTAQRPCGGPWVIQPCPSVVAKHYF